MRRKLLSAIGLAISLEAILLSAAEPKAPSPPVVCALFPVMTTSEGDLFYCDYIASDCNSPDVAYALLDSPIWPYQVCTADCYPSWRDTVQVGEADAKGEAPKLAPVAEKPGAKLAKSTHKRRVMGNAFPGLLKPVELGYIHELPPGKAREIVRVLVDPNLEYLRCQVGEDMFYARVLVLAVTRGNHTDTRYIAFQTSGKPDKFERVTCDPIYPDDDTKCLAYHCYYQPAGTKPTNIMVLGSQ